MQFSKSLHFKNLCLGYKHYTIHIVHKHNYVDIYKVLSIRLIYALIFSLSWDGGESLQDKSEGNTSTLLCLIDTIFLACRLWTINRGEFLSTLRSPSGDLTTFGCTIDNFFLAVKGFSDFGRGTLSTKFVSTFNPKMKTHF